jgi:hypothetical protein
MPITRRIGDEEESFEHLDDCHIFNAQTTVWVPHPYKDEKTGEMTATDFELDDMLSDYEIPTPFADHQEQVRQTAEYAAPQEDINDISASYVHIFSSGDDGIEHAECDDEESNLVENLGSTFKPTLEMARLGIPPKNDEREHKMLKKWRISMCREAKISILMNEGLSRMTAAIQTDMAFEKQARGRGRDHEIAAFLLDFDSDYENASNSAKENEEVENGLIPLISEGELTEDKGNSWCKTCGHTSGEIFKCIANADILSIKEKEYADAFRTRSMRLLVANGLTEDDSEEQFIEFCLAATLFIILLFSFALLGVKI